MASTIRHNRARGTHSIELMTSIVSDLVKSGMSDAWILKNIVWILMVVKIKTINGITRIIQR